MRRALLLGLATALLFSWALPASGHEGADETGHAGALSAQNRWMSMVMSSASPFAENVERVDGDNSSTGGHVAIEGNRLYVGSYGRGMKFYDVSNPASPKKIGEYFPGTPRADAVPDATRFSTPNGTKHIAVLNGTQRTRTVTGGPATVEGTNISEFLDVTDPANPRLLWKFVGPADGEAHNGDISDIYKLWLPSGATGDNGLRIYDLRPLVWSNASAPTRLFPSDSCRNTTATPQPPPQPPLPDPERCDPVTLWEKSPYRGNKPVGQAFTHTHDITIYEKFPVRVGGDWVKRDIILLAEGGDYVNGNNRGSVFVIDITNRAKPVVLLRWIHQSGEGHHPLRYGHEAQFLASDPRLMLVTDEDLHGGPGCTGAGGVYAVRLSANLRSAREVSEWFIPEGTPAAVCSVHVFSSRGDVVFFGSYNAGLQIVDYSDPTNPERIGQYVAEGTAAWGAQYYKGVIYVGDMSRGLDVYQFTG
jgi:hypothetical protein